MNELHDPVKICANVGHVYGQVWFYRCRHDESVRAHIDAWVDQDDTRTERLLDINMAFGPFDDWQDVTDFLHSALAEAIGAVRGS